jgi:peptidoglycan/LPS O-acetylase OafA/YrhL
MSVIAEQRGRAPASRRDEDRSRAVFGIRGLAAVALLTVHVAMFSGLLGTNAFGTHRPPSNVVGAFFVSGLPSFIGVFFVLPALYLYLPLAKAVIAGSERPPQRRNLIRRLLRLLPAYYAMFLVVLFALNRESIDGVWYVLRPIFLLQVYLPSPFVPSLMNGMEITWTVPSMVQWYLALPLIGWAVHRFAARGATPAIRAGRLMLPVPILIAIGVGWLFFVKAQGWDNRIVFWWPQGFAPTIGIGMALAVLLALAQVSPQQTPGLLRAAAARPHVFLFGALIVYLVNCARPFSVIGMDAIYSVSGLLVTYLMVALFGLLATLPLIAPGTRSRFIDVTLANRPVVHLGRVSYGIYLWHFAVMHFYLQPGGVISGHTQPIRELYGTSGFWRLQLVTLAGSVILATVSFYLLEKPIASWAGRRFRDREPASRPPHQRAHPPTVAAPAGELAGAAMTSEEATAAVAAAGADRDTIRSNLLDLERSLGRQLLARASLTGRSAQQWESTTADLASLWEIFTAYSAVVDEATQTLTRGRRSSIADLTRVTELLTGPVIALPDATVPLAQRRITDHGQTRLTVRAAVERMDELFRRTAELLTATETVWNLVSRHLEEVVAELARVRGHRHDEPTVSTAIADADAELHRLLESVKTDPLAWWENGTVNTAAIDRLRRDVAELIDRLR